MMKFLTSVAFAAGCAISLAVPAVRAQTLDMQSSLYENLLERNQAGLHARIRKECGSITNTHLRTGCIDTLTIEEDQRSMGWDDGLTGDGNGRMNSIDRTFQGPEKYDPHFGR